MQQEKDKTLKSYQEYFNAKRVSLNTHRRQSLLTHKGLEQIVGLGVHIIACFYKMSKKHLHIKIFIIAYKMLVQRLQPTLFHRTRTNQREREKIVAIGKKTFKKQWRKEPKKKITLITHWKIILPLPFNWTYLWSVWRSRNIPKPYSSKGKLQQTWSPRSFVLSITTLEVTQINVEH